jgi:2'-5' RNA ligase
MRIFIGIRLDDAVIDAIEKFLKPFKKINTPIRWVKPGNTHITLKFIGEVSTEKYSRIEKTLTETPCNIDNFTVTLQGCGKFGRGGGLNIFWIGMTANPLLEQLYEKIEGTLAKLGIKKEDRPFNAHITVGRNKKNFNFKSLFKLIDENKDHPIVEFPVSHFQLFKSQLTPDGPIYTILKEISLAQT